jgi:hypothetical protein
MVSLREGHNNMRKAKNSQSGESTIATMEVFCSRVHSSRSEINGQEAKETAEQNRVTNFIYLVVHIIMMEK